MIAKKEIKSFKAYVRYFLFTHQMIALQKLQKMLSI